MTTKSTVMEMWSFPVLGSLQVGLGQGANDGMEAVREKWHRGESQKPITVRFCEH